MTPAWDAYKEACTKSQSSLMSSLRVFLSHYYTFLICLKCLSNVRTFYIFQAKFPNEIDIREATMNFINLPSRGRRLVKVPSIVVSGPSFYVGYEEGLSATVAAIPFKKDEFCLVLILPGRPSDYIAGGLSQIESKLNNETWSALMRSLQPIEGIDIQFPVINHR